MIDGPLNSTLRSWALHDCAASLKQAYQCCYESLPTFGNPHCRHEPVKIAASLKLEAGSILCHDLPSQCERF